MSTELGVRVKQKIDQMSANQAEIELVLWRERRSALAEQIEIANCLGPQDPRLTPEIREGMLHAKEALKGIDVILKFLIDRIRYLELAGKMTSLMETKRLIDTAVEELNSGGIEAIGSGREG
jgi:hypothetical protein